MAERRFDAGEFQRFVDRVTAHFGNCIPFRDQPRSHCRGNFPDASRYHTVEADAVDFAFEWFPCNSDPHLSTDFHRDTKCDIPMQDLQQTPDRRTNGSG